MNFDKDYKEFIDHLENTCALRPMKLDNFEDSAVRLFVTYLNIRYAKTSPNQSPDQNKHIVVNQPPLCEKCMRCHHSDSACVIKEQNESN